MHVYQVSSPCMLPLASLRSEEVIFKKIACCCWLSWKSRKLCYTHAYQISSPCVVPLASLRSAEVIKENFLRIFVVVVVMGKM